MNYSLIKKVKLFLCVAVMLLPILAFSACQSEKAECVESFISILQQELDIEISERDVEDRLLNLDMTLPSLAWRDLSLYSVWWPPNQFNNGIRFGIYTLYHFDCDEIAEIFRRSWWGSFSSLRMARLPEQGSIIIVIDAVYIMNGNFILVTRRNRRYGFPSRDDYFSDELFYAFMAVRTQ